MKCAIEWKIALEKDFSVIAKAWTINGKWMWNVYAYILPSHPLFSKSEEAQELPFHGGCTYDKIIKTSPSMGIKYDFQKEHIYLSIGSDYSHCGDDYENHPSGFDGVPYFIQKDCDDLIEALKNHRDTEDK